MPSPLPHFSPCAPCLRALAHPPSGRHFLGCSSSFQVPASFLPQEVLSLSVQGCVHLPAWGGASACCCLLLTHFFSPRWLLKPLGPARCPVPRSQRSSSPLRGEARCELGPGAWRETGRPGEEGGRRVGRGWDGTGCSESQPWVASVRLTVAPCCCCHFRFRCPHPARHRLLLPRPWPERRPSCSKGRPLGLL